MSLRSVWASAAALVGSLIRKPIKRPLAIAADAAPRMACIRAPRIVRTPGKRGTQIEPNHHGEDVSQAFPHTRLFPCALRGIDAIHARIDSPFESAAVRLMPHCSIIASFLGQFSWSVVLASFHGQRLAGVPR